MQIVLHICQFLRMGLEKKHVQPATQQPQKETDVIQENQNMKDKVDGESWKGSKSIMDCIHLFFIKHKMYKIVNL
jgi:hypothetical protein